MARIAYPSLDDLHPETQEFLRGKPLINVFRMWLHAEPLVRPLATLGALQLSSLELSPRLRELIILQCSRRFSAPYEWDQHVPISEAIGITAADRAAIESGDLSSAQFSESEHAGLQFADNVALSPTIDDTSLVWARHCLGDRQLVEIIGLVGYYFSIARMTTLLQIESDAPGGTQVLDAGAALGAAQQE